MFPLPGLVLFPGVVVPLHIFELRYRTMVRDALAGEREVALAVLQSGWESEYFGSPPIHDLGCLARVDEVQWLTNDCYDLRVRGLTRVRFGAMTSEFPYRSMRVSAVPQAPYDEEDPLVQTERHALLEAWRRVAPQPLEESPLLPKEVRSYDVLVSAACMGVEASPEDKLAWLAMDSVLERGHRVREWLETAARPGGPPARGEHN